MGETIVKIIVTLTLAAGIIAVLPESPFDDIIEEIGAFQYLPQINWVIPFGKMMDVTAIWALALGVYYTVRWIGRQLDIIAE